MRKIWSQIRYSSDEGTSLVEVVVAVFILGFVGLSLVGGLGSTNKVVDKTASVISANNTLQTAARSLKEDVQLIGCSKDNQNPYAGIVGALLPANVTIYGDIQAKYIYNDPNAAFTPCSQWSNGQQDVQEITLRYFDPMAKVTQLITVTKSIYDCADCVSQQPVDFSVHLPDATGAWSTAGNLEVVAGDTKSIPLHAVGTNAPAGWSPDLVWQLTTPKAGFISVAVVPDATDPTVGNLAVGVSQDTPAGTYQTTVRAFDLTSNTYSKLVNKNLQITVYPAITINGVSDTSDLETMVGCGFTGTSNLASSAACGPGFGANLTLSGGYGDERIQPGSFGPYVISNAGSVKVGTNTKLTCTTTSVCISFNTAATATGSQKIDIVVAGSKLSSAPNAQALKTLYQANIRSQYGLGTASAPFLVQCYKQGGSTAIGFLASTHDNYCGFTISASARTGSRAGLTSYSAVSGTLANYEADKTPKLSYSSATDTASIAYTVFPTGSNICNGKAAGQYSPATQIASVKDARLSSVSVPVWISIKC